jgi:serine phosphatase RsbU (regulator of sigma subunit)
MSSAPPRDDHPRTAAAVAAALAALGGAEDEQQVLEVVAGRLAPLLGARTAELVLRQPDGTSVRVLTLDPTTSSPARRSTLLGTDDGRPAVRAAVTGRSASAPGQVAVPLVLAGSVLGSLVLTGDGQDRPEPGDELLTAVAAVTAQVLVRVADRVSVESADARAAVSTQRLALVDAVSDLFARHHDPARQDDVVRGLARLVVPGLADWCTLTLAPVGRVRRTVGWAHSDPELEDTLARYAQVQAAAMSENAAVAVALRTGEEVHTRMPPVQDWVGPAPAQQMLRTLAPEQVAVLPLGTGGRPLGAMALIRTGGRPALSADELRTAQEVARRAGLALDNLRLRDRAALLGEVSDRLASTMDAEQAVARLARLVVPTLADFCIVTLVQDDAEPGTPRSLRDIGSWHVEPAQRATLERYLELRLRSARPGAYVLEAAASTGPVPIPPHAADAIRSVLVPGEAADLIGELDPAHGLVLPLRARGRVVGLLTLFAGRGRGPLTDDDLAAATEVAARAALALDNARLYRQQRDLAATLQHSLLSAPARPAGLEVAVRYLPAAAQAEVGGDWYDAFVVPGGALVLVVGDVAGHDGDAAAQMAQLRNVLRGVAQTLAEPPAAVLGELDRALDRLGVATMATAVLCRLEPEVDDAGRRVLRWSNAGHPAPLVIDPDGTVRLLERDPDLLLGVLPSTGRSDHATVLAPGSTVVLYTDGLVERRRETLDDGTARLVELAPQLHGRSAEEVCDVLVERLAVGAQDDVAVLVLRC